jgi:hypothetical protein
MSPPNGAGFSPCVMRGAEEDGRSRRGAPAGTAASPKDVPAPSRPGFAVSPPSKVFELNPKGLNQCDITTSVTREA